jgi:hypothetical protein
MEFIWDGMLLSHTQHYLCDKEGGVFPVHAMKSYSESTGVALIILKLDIRRRWVVNFTTLHPSRFNLGGNFRYILLKFYLMFVCRSNLQPHKCKVWSFVFKSRLSNSVLYSNYIYVRISKGGRLRWSRGSTQDRGFKPGRSRRIFKFSSFIRENSLKVYHNRSIQSVGWQINYILKSCRKCRTHGCTI